MTKHKSKLSCIVFFFVLVGSFIIPLPSNITALWNGPGKNYFCSLLGHYIHHVREAMRPDSGGQMETVMIIGVAFTIQMLVVIALSIILSRNLSILMNKHMSKQIDGSPNQSIEGTG